jgi:SAM-dependent methyltransferase
MLFELRGIAQNLVMGLSPGLRRELYKRLGSTGMDRNVEMVRARFDFYLTYTEPAGKSILELGPGHTPDVLIAARRRGASRCVGLDTELIIEPAEFARLGIEFYSYEGVKIPFGDGSFDIVWSSDVLMLVRSPEKLIADSFRVLRPGGMFLAAIDLRDMTFLADEENWFRCLRYSDKLWWRMTSNRSTFVNRLRASEWRRLFREVGFNEMYFLERKSAILRELHRSGRMPCARGAMSDEDAATYRLDVVLARP